MGDTVQVVLTQETSTVDPRVYLYKGSNLDSSVWSGDDNNEPASISGLIDAIEAGFYYLKVDCNDNHADPVNTYSLTVTITSP